ncbi:lipoyltransferase 1, mitochondrial-like [Ylistrum balloti]|uniref:lipoyltransferase 1, mitochondrial-like n=1 Tax=Ylistrum balloti TaxID=509963 RepID=UPI002905F074|nr:lipoyltransferase 1, mitochondrial-like [Ylistrum balloti]
MLFRSFSIQKLLFRSFRKRTLCVVTQPSLPHDHIYEVIVSKSNDIFANLSLEEWLFENRDLSKNSVLLMWKNRPCIVIGRHQNPWLECNVSEGTALGVNIVRRGSGGGTVYHDEGNLNCSFITDKRYYDRRRNLQFVINAIMSRWDIDLQINERDDIILDQLYKVSGTASRLTRAKTYHHLTLLYRTDLEKLQKILTSPFGTGVNSKATKSVSAQVRNMSDYVTEMDFSKLVKVLGEHFYHEYDQRRFGEIQFVEPTDDALFPGLDKLQSKLQDWEWIYGKTPKFLLKKHYSQTIHGTHFTVTIATEINKGRIAQLDITFLDTNQNDFIESLLSDVRNIIIGQRFWIPDLKVLLQDLQKDVTVGNHGNQDLFSWIVCCLKDAFHIHI